MNLSGGGTGQDARRGRRDARPTREKKAVWFVLALLATATLRAGSVADLDRDNGLPDAKIGAPLASFQGLQKTEDVGRWVTFKRTGENLRYGKVPLTGVTFNFFKDRLYSINLDVEGRGNVGSLIKLLETEYGKDRSLDTLPIPKTAAMMEVREWAGQKVYCVLKNAEDRKGGVLTLLDKPTWDLLQVPKKEKMNQAKQMLGGSFLDGTTGAPPQAQAPDPAPAPAPQ